MKIQTSTKPYMPSSERQIKSLERYGFVLYSGIDQTTLQSKPLMITYYCNNSCRK